MKRDGDVLCGKAFFFVCAMWETLFHFFHGFYIG